MNTVAQRHARATLHLLAQVAHDAVEALAHPNVPALDYERDLARLIATLAELLGDPEASANADPHGILALTAYTLGLAAELPPHSHRPWTPD